MASAARVDHPERWASLLGGAALVAWGANRLAKERGLPVGALLATTGTGLVWYASHRDNAAAQRTGGTTVEEAVAINRPPHELYRFWRDVEQLPRIMPQLSQVKRIDDRRSDWTRGPAGWRTTWHAEIVQDIPNELVTWRTAGRSESDMAGTVSFEGGPVGRGTIVRVTLQLPSTGGVGRAVAWLFGDTPTQVVREGLRRFKQLMEAGEIATTAGQPRGAR